MPYYFYPLFNAVPLVFSGLTWWTQRSNRGRLTGRRGVAFKTALAFNTIASASLFVLVASATLAAYVVYPAIQREVAYNRFILLMIGLGLVSAGLAVSGRGISRVLLIGNGLFVSLFWWVLAGLGL